mgnify:CR=1 FL=1
MPKTKDAFALRDFDEDRILARKIFYPLYETYIKVDDDLWSLKGVEIPGILATDNQTLDLFCEIALRAQNKYDYCMVQFLIEQLNDIAKKALAYEKKIWRHCKRLEKYSRKWNEAVCSDESFSADAIRTKTRRLQKLLKSYDDVQNAVKNLQVLIQVCIAEITDAYEKADQKIFAMRLRQARTAAGLTQTQLANRIGMTQGGYTGYENSIREPSIATLKRLSRILNTPTDWLLGLTP